MFEDIEQLEKEVQEFRQNMLGSTALLKSLDAIVAALMAQTAELSAKSAEMAGKMDSQSTAIQNKTDDTLQKLVANLADCVVELRKMTDGAVERLSAENKANLTNTTTQILSTQKAYIETLQATERALHECKEELQRQTTAVVDRLCAENKQNLADTVAQFLAAQKEYTDTLRATENAIQACSLELSKKHSEFLERLEKTNIDQIYQACVDMRKSVESKLTILLAGVGVAVILTIVGLFI